MDRLRAKVGTPGPCVESTYATQRLAGVLTGHERPPERRSSWRFLIECEIRYRVVDVEVFSRGKTVNISTGGMLIVTDRLLPAGMQLQVEVDWPPLVDAAATLKLVAMCTVVRSEIGAIVLTAVKISRHEFRSTTDQSISEK